MVHARIELDLIVVGPSKKYRHSWPDAQMVTYYDSIFRLGIVERKKLEIVRNKLMGQPAELILLRDATVVSLRLTELEERHFCFDRDGILIEEDGDIWLKVLFGEQVGCLNDIYKIFGEVVDQGKKIENAKVFTQHSYNFSHYLFDGLAPLREFREELRLVPVIGSKEYGLNGWQNELWMGFDLPRWEQTFEWGSGRMHIAKYKELYYPYCPGLIHRMSRVGDEIRRIWGRSDSRNLGPVFLTRHDNRRGRITNVDEIESYVQSMGGECIDQSKLSWGERLQVLSGGSALVGEGSGIVVGSQLAKAETTTVNLLDPIVLEDESFLYGGLPYFWRKGESMKYIIGTSRKVLEGSPLGSCRYDIEEIDACLS